MADLVGTLLSPLLAAASPLPGPTQAYIAGAATSAVLQAYMARVSALPAAEAAYLAASGSTAGSLGGRSSAGGSKRPSSAGAVPASSPAYALAGQLTLDLGLLRQHLRALAAGKGAAAAGASGGEALLQKGQASGPGINAGPLSDVGREVARLLAQIETLELGWVDLLQRMG